MTAHRGHLLRRTLFLLALFLLLVIAFFVSVSVGTKDIPFFEIIRILFGEQSEINDVIIWRIRLPRALTAVVAGIGLAAAGAAMQSILRNPLGSPYTLGVSQAAAFGAAFAVVVLGAGSHHSAFSDAVEIDQPYVISICAFLFSMVSTGVIILLARFRGARPETMILTGVALGSFFVAGTTALEYLADDIQLSSIVFWTFGDVGRAYWNELAIIAAVVIPAGIYFLYNSWNYNALDAGDDTARSLGVNVERVRVIGLAAASLVTALIVSFVGIIGFVGLVVPHMIRRVIGGDERTLMIGSMIGGALLLLVSDTVARTIISPMVLPVGILTSFLGAPLFILLVIKGRDHW